MPIEDKINIDFTLSNNWFLNREAVVFGVFEEDTGPCGLNFNEETIEKGFSDLEPVFKSIKLHLGQGDFKAKFGETLLCYVFDKSPIKKIILMGLGKKTDFTDEKLRQAGARAAQYARELKFKKFAVTLFGAPKMSAENRFRGLIEGVALSLYRFDKYKTVLKGEENKTFEIEFLFPENIDVSSLKWSGELKRSSDIISAVYFTRDLINNPSSVVTPEFLAQTALEISKSSAAFSCEILKKDDLKKNEMNAILEVGKGSGNDPRFIVLKYSPAEAVNKNPIVLVGKGVCFDSGGLSLQPSDDMHEMKMDMAGAAVVLGVLKAVANLKIPFNVVGVIPAVENIPGPNSYKPADIIKAYNGKTIEVLNTDAEGRIILADALSYAVKNFNPELVVDLATLTSACIVALGYHFAGVLGNDDNLVADLVDAGKKTYERVWPLPLDDDYKKQIESEIADVKNIGGGGGGAITAAMFLKEFVGNTPWAHIDIAGPAMLREKKPYAPRGGSGFGVRLMIEFLEKRIG